MTMPVLRDLSVILLAAGTSLFALIPLALFGVLVYGVWRLRSHENLPSWLRLTREYATAGLSYVELAMDALTKPVFAAHLAFATVQGWLRGVCRRER